MSNYTYFPGFSPRNEETMQLYTEYWQDKGCKLFTHGWRHWENSELGLDIQTELELIDSELKQQGLDLSKGFVHIAKSVGSVVTMYFLQKTGYRPEHLVLMGIPLQSMKLEQRDLFQALVAVATYPITIIQNSADPVGSFKEVRDFFGSLSSKPNIELVEVEANHHRYQQPGLVWELIGKN